MEHLKPNEKVPPVPARNRRIGEILKALRLAEMRGTGIPKIRRTMAQNGSPEPSFHFDENRTFFQVILPAHPQYLIVHSIRQSSYLWSIGKRHEAVNQLKQVFDRHPNSGAIAGELIEYLYDLGQDKEAELVFEQFHHTSLRSEVEVPYLRYFTILLRNNKKAAATKVIQSLPEDEWDNVEVAVAFKRLKIYDRAHPIFTRIYASIESDPIHLHDYAQTKIEIANQMRNKRRTERRTDWVTINKLRNEAIELLRRAVQLLEGSKNVVELAWCWFDMARTMQYGRIRPGRPYPNRQIQEAYDKAMQLLPDESRFRQAYEKWQEYIAHK